MFYGELSNDESDLVISGEKKIPLVRLVFIIDLWCLLCY